MENYFNDVVNRLRIEELDILAHLCQNEADAPFKSIKGTDVMDLVQMSKSKYFRSLDRLKALYFVDFVESGKSQKLFITQYGKEALQKSLEGVIE